MLYLKLYNIEIKLETDSQEFERFVINSLKSYVINNNKKTQISIKIFFKKDVDDYSKRLLKYLGSEIYYGENDLFWKTKRIKIYVSKNSNHINVLSSFKFRVDQKIRKHLRVKGDYENNLFLVAYRYAFLYPLMALLSNEKKFSVIHAAAIYSKRQNNAILFIGLNGVGKSSTAYNLCASKEYQLLSDNFVFISGSKVYPIPEVLRLPKDINTNYPEENVIGTANGKILVTNKVTNDIEAMPIKSIFFVMRNMSNKETKIIEIDNDTSLDLLYGIANYLKEYENHSYISFLEKQKYLIDYNNYLSLIDNTKTYIYEIGTEENSFFKLLQFFKG